MDNVKEEWRDIEISGIAYDSRDVKKGPPGKGFMFVARKGLAQDGHKYIDDAIKNGASVVVVEKDQLAISNCQLPIIVVEDGREALADISDKFYGSPSSKLNLIGITGTNGKTTTTLLLKAIYEEYGIKTGVIGTINCFIGDKKYKSERTTPESLDINKLLSSMIEKGVETVIAEVSSHALALDRVRGIDFDIAGLTNISRDHLDFHNSMEDYIGSKQRLFSGVINHAPALAVLNRDDTFFERFRDCTDARVISYGEENADITGKIIQADINGMEVEIREKTEDRRQRTERIRSHITGMHNLYNILLSFGISRGDGIPPIFIKRGIEKLKGIDGRFEVIEQRIVIDYAHTPASLESVLKSARTFTKTGPPGGKLISIFGCGGNRDKGKRPIMGEISTRVADLTIITSDNPRDENPSSIIEDIEEGVKGRYKVIVDRKEAIEAGIKASKEGDVVVIAGKGHEDYQIIGDKTIPFSDREIAKKIMQKSKIKMQNDKSKIKKN